MLVTIAHTHTLSTLDDRCFVARETRGTNTREIPIYGHSVPLKKPTRPAHTHDPHTILRPTHTHTHTLKHTAAATFCV